VAALFRRPNRTVTGFVAPSVSTFLAARFRFFDFGVTSDSTLLTLPTAISASLPMLHEVATFSSTGAPTATLTSGFVFLRRIRLGRLGFVARLGVALFIPCRVHLYQAPRRPDPGCSSTPRPLVENELRGKALLR
jgi:hypothetical protein